MDVSDVELLSKERLAELLKSDDIVSCEMDDSDLDKINQLSFMRWGTVKFGSAPERCIVLKASRAGNDRAKTYGLAREGLFYKEWRQLAADASETSEKTCELLAGFLANVFFAEGDMDTGAKRILMEDLSTCVQAGYFFGKSNPNNWGKDLDKAIAGFSASAATVTDLCFCAAAELHAGFWKSEKLVGSSKFGWLRGSSWLAGEGKVEWEDAVAAWKNFWDQAKAKAKAADVETVNWDPFMVELLDEAMAKLDWAEYQLELQRRPFTLTHGDFHPANFMVRPSSASHKLALLDWEMVGVGSGPQDLGQFMISHVEPAQREAIEEAAVRRYFDELVRLNPGISASMTWDQCWEEYVQGGMGRWLWFVPVLAAMCPAPMGQFFHDQVLAFAKAHGVTKESVPMPRF
eukprot:gnl/TRDRNA2_/TRDRNA2_157880_c0_seq1.p1 gnl/TRDRNA2_/TRDRNA2_157880_c0~~gnl/TRDRNA2_/TRDRNA2_157880_c0_seq1.p1  ORF type:complete len:404 (+),score=88.79 gnl/TRDRNA2_/TRDRNA2_157880_c0_seq1:163-1374(+)